jgi:hypothetical protein
MAKLRPLPSAATAPFPPVWFEYFKDLDAKVRELDARGILSLPGVSLPTPISNGQVLVFDSTSQTFIPGAN